MKCPSRRAAPEVLPRTEKLAARIISPDAPATTSFHDSRRAAMNILLPMTLLTTSHALSADSVYWWNYQERPALMATSPRPSCGKASKGDVEGLKKCCSNIRSGVAASTPTAS